MICIVIFVLLPVHLGLILINNQLDAQFFHVCLFLLYTCFWRGTAVAKWLRCCATNREVAVSIPAGVSEFFIDIKSFRSHYGPGVDSASNINEYQKYFLGGKGGRCVRLTTLPPSCTVVTKSGNFNFLAPSGALLYVFTCFGQPYYTVIYSSVSQPL